MGRPPLNGKRAMTTAERLQRWRERHGKILALAKARLENRQLRELVAELRAEVRELRAQLRQRA